ncbi:hypothetical protein Bbelb_362740 [Branchiostoma belcheri]|nr:hypothetical protein Bbelb_362740 [Branchiostoma belcheri]
MPNKIDRDNPTIITHLEPPHNEHMGSKHNTTADFKAQDRGDFVTTQVTVTARVERVSCRLTHTLPGDSEPEITVNVRIKPPGKLSSPAEESPPFCPLDTSDNNPRTAPWDGHRLRGWQDETTFTQERAAVIAPPPAVPLSRAKVHCPLRTWQPTTKAPSCSSRSKHSHLAAHKSTATQHQVE